MLFLAKGRRPVVAAKLKHQPKEDWNHHRKDLANVVTYAEKCWKRDLTWQIIDADAAKTEDLLEAPVLYICGEEAPDLDDEQQMPARIHQSRRLHLRRRGVRGKGIRPRLSRPDRAHFSRARIPARLLPPEHPIWTPRSRSMCATTGRCGASIWAAERAWRTARKTCRATGNWPDRIAKRNTPPRWRRKIDAAKKIGVNVLAYATNRDPKYKLDLPQLAGVGPREAFDRAKLYVATVKHSGGGESGPPGATEPAALSFRRVGMLARTPTIASWGWPTIGCSSFRSCSCTAARSFRSATRSATS